MNKEDLDSDLKEELNRRYAGREDEPGWDDRNSTSRVSVRLVALLVALLFIFTVTGQRLYVFSGPVFAFLRESLVLSGDPLVRELRSSVVVIQADRYPGTSRHSRRGSGFNVDAKGLVVTNRHVVEDAALVRISIPGRGVFTVGQWIESPDLDLALLNIDAEDLPYVNLSREHPRLGQEVLVIGNPLQFARIANLGILSGFRESGEEEVALLMVEAPVYPGSSGSPLFNEHGEVVGVVFATLRNNDDRTVTALAVPAREVKLLLEQAGLDKD